MVNLPTSFPLVDFHPQIARANINEIDLILTTIM